MRGRHFGISLQWPFYAGVRYSPRDQLDYPRVSVITAAISSKYTGDAPSRSPTGPLSGTASSASSSQSRRAPRSRPRCGDFLLLGATTRPMAPRVSPEAHARCRRVNRDICIGDGAANGTSSAGTRDYDSARGIPPNMQNGFAPERASGQDVLIRKLLFGGAVSQRDYFLFVWIEVIWQRMMGEKGRRGLAAAQLNRGTSQRPHTQSNNYSIGLDVAAGARRWMTPIAMGAG